MLYLLSGPNSYHALRKIKEFKEAFLKKHGNLLVEEFDGEVSAPVPVELHSILSQINLFSKIRLVIFKNIFADNAKTFEILEKYGDFLKNSRDIFVFWEKDLEKYKEILSFFKKFAEKTQEMKTLGPKELDIWLSKKAQVLGLQISKEEREIMIDEAGEGAEWALKNELEKVLLSERFSERESVGAPRVREGGLRSSETESVSKKPGAEASPFAFIEKMFGSRALLALKEMALAGIEPQRFIYAFLWKLKQKRMADAYLQGIIAESQMKRDPKNAEEILERFIFSLKA